MSYSTLLCLEKGLVQSWMATSTAVDQRNLSLTVLTLLTATVAVLILMMSASAVNQVYMYNTCIYASFFCIEINSGSKLLAHTLLV